MFHPRIPLGIIPLWTLTGTMLPILATIAVQVTCMLLT